MAAQPDPSPQPRVPLSKERVFRAALLVADEGGIESLTMRKLAQELGVEAMSLYYHVANKDEVLDGMIELVMNEINEAASAIDLPSHGGNWKTAMRTRILTARQVLLSHPWAPGVIETRSTMSPETIRYFDDLLGQFREGGFSYHLAHHAMHALGSRALGFSQELFEPDDNQTGDEETASMLEQMGDRFPYLVEMLAEVVHDDPDSTLGWCDDQTEFEFGLDLILDGLDQAQGTA